MKTHPLVQVTRKALRKFPADPQGVKRFRQVGCLPITSSDATAERILLICDRLFKLIEAAGGTVEVRKTMHDLQAFFVIYGENLAFGIRELTVRRRNPHTDARNFDRKYIYIPTGKVAMYIGGYHRMPVRNQWCDTGTSLLEDEIDDVLASCRAWAGLRAEKKREDEAMRPLWEEQQRIEALERRRHEQLDAWLKDWRKANDIRALISDFRRRRSTLGVGSTEDLAEFLTWAEGIADRLDPTAAE